jgi:hypothetical protein
MIRFGEGRFEGKAVADQPTCPFCGRRIDRPKEAATELPVGSCPCGAVYACDVTGHSLGTALVEALALACQGDWETASNLSSDKDYEERQVSHYDLDTHSVFHGGVYRGRRISGTLLFITLLKGSCQIEDKPHQELPAETVSASSLKPLTKKEVESLVEDYDFEPLLAAAEGDKSILFKLKRLLYSADHLIRFRAAEATGRVSAVIARRDRGSVSKFLQGLFSSVTDTAASSWGALDAIGEIISRNPEFFSQYIPRLSLLARERSLLAEVLRAMAKIGQKEPDLLGKASCLGVTLLKDQDPQVRGQAVILLGHFRVAEAKEDLGGLLDDRCEVEVYKDGALEKRTIGNLAYESLKRL